MASSMLTAEVPASTSTEADADKALQAAFHLCLNDPNFAIICDFLQKFSNDLGLDLPNFKLLLQWLTKTDEVSPQLRDIQIKLLRKTRKTVHEKSWESALSKFCFTYSVQDGWEIERFGYKNSSVHIKLRILRELLECQFEHNTKFRTKILTLSADSLRSKPIGRDRQGHAYWVTQDNDCNISIYQEHLDEEIWQVVATNRGEFVNLLSRLRGSEVVLPCRDFAIVDEDTTSSSSQMDSLSIQKAPLPQQIDDSQEDEQKVPKLSIKLSQGINSIEINSTKHIGKGEEELAEEEDAKLLKKSFSTSEVIESAEEEFEEIEEEYDDENSIEAESEDEIKEQNIANKVEKKLKKDIKSEDENKRVKPLLISQNKVIKMENCSSTSSASKKRRLDQRDTSSPLGIENQELGTQGKCRPSLLDSKRCKTANKYSNKKLDTESYEESDNEDVELEEEVEEEDIDSVAAEEDENEEKLFDMYDNENEEEEELGKEISDPIIHVTGEGSGKDCDVENYLYCIDYDLDNNNQLALSDVIVEDVYYLQGEGNGIECLGANTKSEDEATNGQETNCSSKTKKIVEQKSELPSEKYLSQNNKSTLSLEDNDCHNKGTSKKSVLNHDGLNDPTNLAKDVDGINETMFDQSSEKNTQKGNEKEKQSHLKRKREEISHINGEEICKIENEDLVENESPTISANENVPLAHTKNPLFEKTSETSCEEDKKTSCNITLSDVSLTDIDVITMQKNKDKMLVLESLKKELRESKQKLLEKKSPEKVEASNIKLSNPEIYNRKRRLTDKLQSSSTRPSNSESDIDVSSENTEDYLNENVLEKDESNQDIVGKRLKLRPKQSNAELRKKIEAQKVAENEEDTSSSGGEEKLRKRKKIVLSKQSTIPTILKTDKNLPNFESRKDVAKYDKNSSGIDGKTKSVELSQESQSLKLELLQKPAKNKPTLAEIIEKKLKKTPEKNFANSTPTDIDSTMEEVTTTKELFPSPIKRLITKPIKKNLLLQIRQVESDEDKALQNFTNSQPSDTSDLCDFKSFVTTTKSVDKIISKTEVEKPKTTIERQRKRRSSEETVQNDSPEEPEAKKEVVLVKQNVTSKREKPTECIEQEILEDPKDLKANLKNEPSSSVSGRRSGRRSGPLPTFVDTLQSKRNRSSVKNLTKVSSTEGVDKRLTNEPSNSLNTNKSNAEKLAGDKSIFIHDKRVTKENEINKNINLLEIKKNDVSKSKSESTATKTPTKGIRKQREVDATNIIDVDSETPVRQSRRIAQQKIREEAERRKLEEIALRSMKQELKKKKKAEKQTDPTVVPPTEPSSESEESDANIKRKVQKKKCPGKNGNWSSGSEEQEEPEEEDEEHHHYETDPGSPLFKSDHEFSPESDIEDDSLVVPTKRARTVRKEDTDDAAAIIAAEEEEACQKCNKSDHPEWILLCDKCDKGYHCSCLSPVLFYIPEGDWFCPPCQQEDLITALETQLKEFDDLVENKRKIEEEEKRMAEEEKARKELEEETNKHKAKKEKRVNLQGDISSSSDNSQEDDDDAATNSDVSRDCVLKNDSVKKKNRNRLRNFKNRDKRNHRDRKSNATRNRRNRFQKRGSDSDTGSQDTSNSKSISNSTTSSSSTYSDSDNEPIYKLRKRRQINVSYRLNEYDDLINSALKKEMDEAAGAGNLGRGKDISTIIEADKEEKARQKQIEDSDNGANSKGDNKIAAEDTMKDSLSVEINETNKDEVNEEIKIEDIDSDGEPIIHKLNIKPSLKKKSRKLTTLDISSEDDNASDEDFKGSSIDDEEEEDTSISASNSDSSLEIYKRHGKLKKKRRKAARRAFRERRRVRRFVVEESDDEDAQRPKSKKKRKYDSDYTESEADDDEISELSENIDSADLCDDTTTDESDGAWKPNKRKKAKKPTAVIAQKSPKSKNLHKKPKKVEYSDDDISDSEEDEDDNEEVGCGKGMGKQPRSQPLIKTNSISTTKIKGKGKEKPVAKARKKTSSDNNSSESDSEDSTRRTRGRRYAYIEDFDDDSSDGGIKPGVKRPDTPPEEREKFIKRQEEIKRMLAEKNAEGAKLVATPRLTPIKTDGEKDKRSPAKLGGDSLSKVPSSVIREAKVLDIDYLQRRGENLEDLTTEVGEVGEVGDEFDDADLPDDLPEDMDEDTIARMVEEEEEFGVAAAKELPPPDDILRIPKSAKSKEVEKPILPGNSSQIASTNLQTIPVTLPAPTSGLQEPVRKRFPMPTMHPPLLRHQYLMHESTSNTHHGGPHTSHFLQNALSAPLTQSLDRNYPSITPSAPQQSLINRMADSMPLQATGPHALSTTRPPTSNHTKSSSLFAQQAQEKSNPQNVTESKPRSRRKKITPLRDTLQKQQTAAAVTAATASSSALSSSLVKNSDSPSNSLLSSVMKSGLTSKLIMQTNSITNMTPTSHTAPSRSGVPMPPIRSPYIRTDGARFYEGLGNRMTQSSGPRHRGQSQLPPSLLPPHPANRSSYGPPPPLKGPNASSPAIPSNQPGSIRNPLHHVSSTYLEMPPNARHASHLNMYRPPIYSSPNFAPRVNIRPPNIHQPDYSSGSRAFPPYGFYPPPPPLTTPVPRSGPDPLPRHSTQMPPVQTSLTHPSASVIVSAISSKSSTVPSIASQANPALTAGLVDSNSSSKSSVTQELIMKNPSSKSSSPVLVIVENSKAVKHTMSVEEPRKKLTTLQAYTASNDKKPSMLVCSDSSESQSPHNTATEANDESSPPEHSGSTPAAEQATKEEAQASEFSGLVSYFSSQHDDYNT